MKNRRRVRSSEVLQTAPLLQCLDRLLTVGGVSADGHNFCLSIPGGTCGESLSLLAGETFLGTSVSPASTPTKKIPGAEGEHPLRLTRQKADLEIEKSEFSTDPFVYTCQFTRATEKHGLFEWDQHNIMSLQF